MERTYSHIDLDERRKIARWRMAGLSVGIIAEKLGRHRSTIFREIKRNMFVDKVIPDLNGYYCVTAHDMACERRAKLRKLVRFSHVRQSVIDRIIHGWSPQQIAGRMRLERHPISVSHETIYKFAYSADGHAIKLWRHLPEHRARRRPRHARRKHGQRFSPDLNILRRPDVVADRKQFGHWECDLIQFRKKFGKANVTSLVERVSITTQCGLTHRWATSHRHPKQPSGLAKMDRLQHRRWPADQACTNIPNGSLRGGRPASQEPSDSLHYFVLLDGSPLSSWRSHAEFVP